MLSDARKGQSLTQLCNASARVPCIRCCRRRTCRRHAGRSARFRARTCRLPGGHLSVFRARRRRCAPSRLLYPTPPVRPQDLSLEHIPKATLSAAGVRCKGRLAERHQLRDRKTMRWSRTRRLTPEHLECKGICHHRVKSAATVSLVRAGLPVMWRAQPGGTQALLFVRLQLTVTCAA